jgi:acetyl esterase/lipase
MSWLKRRFRQALIVLFFSTSLAAPIAGYAEAEFYQASEQVIPGRSGTLIRQEPMRGAPLGAKAYRVLYRSTGLRGESIAVSGVVVVPPGPAPAGGRPIVAWAHTTTGIVPHCAPSLAIFGFQQIEGLRVMVRRGYIVAATDYPGLGTPAPHPYLVGTSEGRAVLDSLRAARELLGTAASSRVGIWGHSQGGQAALYAALLAKEYAPELELAGVAVAAPATDLGSLMRDDLPTPGGKNLLAMTLWAWSRVFNISLEKVVDPAAMPTINALAHVCLESPIDLEPRRRAGAALQRRFLLVNNLTGIEPWRTLLAGNTIGPLPPSIPVFIAQGSADHTVDPPVTQAYMKALCAAGSRVHLLMLPGVGHGTVAMKSALRAVAWMANRFEGSPAENDCLEVRGDTH